MMATLHKASSGWRDTGMHLLNAFEHTNNASPAKFLIDGRGNFKIMTDTSFTEHPDIFEMDNVTVTERGCDRVTTYHTGIFLVWAISQRLGLIIWASFCGIL